MSDEITLPDSGEYEQFSKKDKHAPKKKTGPRGRKSGIEAIEPPEDQNVTGKERDFCLNYMMTGNATLAAKQAGIPSPQRRGNQLLEDPRIRAYVKAIMQVYEEHLELERETFVNMLKFMVVAKIDDFMDNWDKLKDFDKIPSELLHAVREVSINDYKNAKGEVTRTRTQIKLVDKVPYMDMWAKIRDFYRLNNQSKKTIEIKFT